MFGGLSAKPATAGLLALAGVAWSVALARGERPMTLERTGPIAFFVIASFGGAVAVWIAHKRAAPATATDAEPSDPNGVFVGAALFGCVSFVGALLVLFAGDFVERYLD
ncbi:MAG: hypothetical protein K8S98_00835 [Planctomycetes bacterium]|nr:hypothetical protein [Planctomycetota bacterium]